MPKQRRRRSTAARGIGKGTPKGQPMRFARRTRVMGGPVMPNPGSLLGAGASLLRRITTRSVPSSASPISPMQRLSGEVARNTSGYRMPTQRRATKRVGTRRKKR